MTGTQQTPSINPLVKLKSEERRDHGEESGVVTVHVVLV